MAERLNNLKWPYQKLSHFNFFWNTYFIYYIWIFFQLRLLYESSPMSFIIEQAGGQATTGTQRILDLEPKTIHERCPVYMGSKDDVQDVIDIYKKHQN